jgi:hypothetical protein
LRRAVDLADRGGRDGAVAAGRHLRRRVCRKRAAPGTSGTVLHVADKLILATDAEVVRYAVPLDALATSCVAGGLIAAVASAAAA